MKIASIIMAIGLFIILCILAMIDINTTIDDYIFGKENKNVNMRSRRRLSSLDDE